MRRLRRIGWRLSKSERLCVNSVFAGRAGGSAVRCGHHCQRFIPRLSRRSGAQVLGRVRGQRRAIGRCTLFEACGFGVARYWSLISRISPGVCGLRRPAGQSKVRPEPTIEDSSAAQDRRLACPVLSPLNLVAVPLDEFEKCRGIRIDVDCVLRCAKGTNIIGQAQQIRDDLARFVG